MKSHVLLTALLFSILILPLSVQALEFTEWMPRQQFGEFMDETGKKDVNDKNFWDRGHRIEAVECKWEDGWQKYRIAIGKTPKDKAHWWMWYFDMSEEFFEDRLTDLSKDGYRLAQMNVSENPNGKKVYAAVWHKIKEKDTSNPQSYAKETMKQFENPELTE